jgi:hypothetical protein
MRLPLVLQLYAELESFIMAEPKREPKKGKSAEKNPPPPTLSGEPDREIELKVKKHPEDKDAKADLGSDESMDASDPSSATQPGSSKPAPSSGFPE